MHFKPGFAVRFSACSIDLQACLSSNIFPEIVFYNTLVAERGYFKMVEAIWKIVMSIFVFFPTSIGNAVAPLQLPALVETKSSFRRPAVKCFAVFYS